MQLWLNFKVHAFLKTQTTPPLKNEELFVPPISIFHVKRYITGNGINAP